jgi:hypothetical protein
MTGKEIRDALWKDGFVRLPTPDPKKELTFKERQRLRQNVRSLLRVNADLAGLKIQLKTDNEWVTATSLGPKPRT